MAITSAQIAAMPQYTNAEIVIMLKAAIIAVTVNQSSSIFGQSVTRADLGDLTAALEFFQNQVATESTAASGGGVALVRYGERY